MADLNGATAFAAPCEQALAGLPSALLVAVSGGVDSVALLSALVRTGRKPVVLHFNHGWREESKLEEKALRALVRQQGLRAVVGRMSPRRKSEADARQKRYAFFARSAAKLGIRDLVLAHHADDQVETFLLQLLRGTGASARGMDPLATRGELILHRPWLGIWKKEIVAHARTLDLSWSEDASNLDIHRRRNQVRRRLIPYLRKTIGANVSENLWRAAEVLRAESEWLDRLCSELSNLTELPVSQLRAQPLAQQRRTILRWLQRQGIADISFHDVEAVRGLVEKREPARINLSRGRFGQRRAGFLFLT